MNNFVLMARFNAWVNEQLYDCIAQLSDADYRKDRKLFFGSIHITLNHLLIVDRLWTCRIKEMDHGIQSLKQILYDDFESLRAARKEEDAALIALVESLSDERLRTEITYKRMIGQGIHETRIDHILLTLYNHQTHHRGQLHAALTQLDIEPPPLDVIYFLEELGLS